MIITPGQLHQRAEFYYQLGQLLVAGITLPQALQRLQAHPPSRSFRRPIQELVSELNQGSNFSESLRRVGDWLPELDIAVLEAGEESGRLDTSLRVLSDYYRSRAQSAQQFLGDLAYPAFLLHFAILILPFPQLFVSGDFVAYAWRTAGFLLPLYAIVGLAVFALQSRHGEVWRALVETALSLVPVLGTSRRSLAISRLCIALESLLNAGVNVVQAWELAAAASGSPRLKRLVRSWQAPLADGQTPAELVARSGFFPEVFVSQYTTGEISGRLDEMLRRLHDYFQEDGNRRMRTLAQWTPRLIYLLIAVYIAYRIISFWQGYFGQLQTIGDL